MVKKIKVYLYNFNKYKHLLKELVVNDIKIKYQRSVLGVIWSVLHPLMIMIVLTTVFSTLFKMDIENYPVYVLSGRLIWDLYFQSTIFAQNSIADNASLIKKVYVPKYIFPIAKCLTAVVNTAFSSIALLFVMAVTGVTITPVLLLLPIAVFYLVLFSMGIGLIMATFTVFFRDLVYLYEVFLTAWMYLTPVFYPASILPESVQFILKINPISYYLDFFRDIVLYSSFPDIKTNLMCFGIGIVTFFLGVIIFYKKQDRFILYV
jgi:ABC-2 type transport system permease protein